MSTPPSSASSTASQEKSSAAAEDGGYAQVIDESGSFSASESALSSIVAATLPSPHSSSYSLIGIMGAQSGGKCFARGTRLRLINGDTIAAEDVVGGEELMGDDGLPRIVTLGSLSQGSAPLYSITPDWGGAQPFTVNGAHILVLLNNTRPSVVAQSERGTWQVAEWEVNTDNCMRRSSRTFRTAEEAEKEVDLVLAGWEPLEWEVSVEEFLAAPKEVRQHCTLVSCKAITFNNPQVPSLSNVLEEVLGVPPSTLQLEYMAWWLGIWMTNGANDRPSISHVGPPSIDADGHHPSDYHHEVLARLLAYQPLFNEPVQRFDKESTAGSVAFRFDYGDGSVAGRVLRHYALFDAKDIPWALICDSIDVRQRLLAGIIDGDGWFNVEQSCYELSCEDLHVLQHYKELAATLGLRNSAIDRKTCTNQRRGGYRFNIAGDMWDVTRYCAITSKNSPQPIPDECRMNDSRCYGFSITERPAGEYFGFAVHGGINLRFLLADYTVTHNSTLLNLLFGCHFRVMDATDGRSQTTKGIWIDAGIPSLSHTHPPPPNQPHPPSAPTSLIIMDLEGTDSGERGEDRTTFERQTSLFALSLSDVLILNLWHHDIGRYTASNYGILKTVMEVNLSLFSPTTRTVILIIIRDHELDTPLAALQDKLRAEIDRMWGEIRKPPTFASTPLDALFSFHYAALPHMKHERAAFDKGVEALRDRFLNPQNPQYLYSGQGEGDRGGVPAEGFGMYVKGIWETIRANKDLSLPSQKEMLATYRCDEIIGQQVLKLSAEVRERKESEQWMSAFTPSFASTASALLQAAVSAYDELTQYYHPDIVTKKRMDLLTRCAEVIEEPFNAQSTFLLNDAFAAFQASLSASLLSTFTQDKDIPNDWGKYVREAQQLAFDWFEAHGKEVGVEGVDGLKVEGRRGELQSRMDERIARERTKVLGLVDGILEAKAKASLTAPLALTLKKAEPTLWQDLHALYQSTKASISQWLSTKASAYQMTEAEVSGYQRRLSESLEGVIRSAVEAHASLILLHMRRRFDRLFRYDDDGFVRKWKGSDDIRAVFRQCQAEALTLLDLFSTFRLTSLIRPDSSSLSSEGDVLIPPARRSEIEYEFPDEVEGALREAEAEQERIRASRRLPAWGLAMILFLGFDEFLALLRNPLMLVMVVGIGGMGWFLWTSGMLRPAMMVVGQGVKVALTWVEGNGIQVGGVRDALQGIGLPVGEGSGEASQGQRRHRGDREGGVELVGKDAMRVGNRDVAEDSHKELSGGVKGGVSGESEREGGGARQRVKDRRVKAMTITNAGAVSQELSRGNNYKGQ